MVHWGATLQSQFLGDGWEAEANSKPGEAVPMSALKRGGVCEALRCGKLFVLSSCKRTDACTQIQLQGSHMIAIPTMLALNLWT